MASFTSSNHEMYSKDGYNISKTTSYYDLKYTIQKGDNLTSIAEQFGTTVDDLVEMNGLESSKSTIYARDEIKVGQDSVVSYDVSEVKNRTEEVDNVRVKSNKLK